VAERPSPLAATLLHKPRTREPETVDGGAWAYSDGRLALTAVSLVVGYHLLALLLYITPKGGLAREAKDSLAWALKTRTYIRTTANTQAWSMFAPNPHRRNIFVRVLIEDQAGETWDLGHDMYGRRAYPYVVYDRLAKINRRLAGRGGYHGVYGAYACREWERLHGGEPAKRVRLVKIWTDIPPPKIAYNAPPSIRPGWTSIGFDPMRLPLHREPLKEFECARLREGQLSPARREALGFPPAPEGHYRPTEHRTWVTRVDEDNDDDGTSEGEK